MRRLALCLLLAVLPACHDRPAPAGPGAPNALQTVDLRAGDGAAIAAGQTAIVDYTGWLYDERAPEHKGRQFDSSRSPGGAPFKFKLGAGEVIPGWDRGLVGLKVHGQRRLTIPPELAYGEGGQGPIPPGATLVFDVELIGAE
jgi:FKBP-type peptidyl-prolyl cis-trans isomerase